jgi:hypothetical protein
LAFDLHSVWGMHGPVMFGEHHASVADRIINNLRAAERRGLVEVPDPFEPGQRIRICKGPGPSQGCSE